jgi:putative endonuclease
MRSRAIQVVARRELAQARQIIVLLYHIAARPRIRPREVRRMTTEPSLPSPGTVGEEVAALLLATRGYRMLARNVRFGRREIDLVVERGSLLVAVEVKWRSGTEAGTAWGAAQRRRSAEAVQLAMGEGRFADADRRPWRFDLVTIAAAPSGWTIEHRKGVWSPGNSWW